MKHLCLVCIGENYIKQLSHKLTLIDHKEYLLIHILTDNLKYTKKIVSNTELNEKIILYYLEEQRFSYFYKFYFSLDIAIKYQETVDYVDIARTELLSKFITEFNKVGIHYISSWGPFLSNALLLKDYGCEYFEKGYWNDFISKLYEANIDPSKIVPITEQVLVINYSEKLKLLKENLEKLEVDFINYSMSKKSVYKKTANGEGLALGYSAFLLNIPLHLLKRQANYLI